MEPNLTIKPNQVVAIKWVDSYSVQGWVDDGKYTQAHGHIVSAGIVVQNTPELIVLTTSVNDEGTVLDPIAIPWLSIIEIKSLDLFHEENQQKLNQRAE